MPMAGSILRYFLLVLLFESCTHDKGKIVVPEVTCNTPAVVSFSSDIIPIFDKYCNTSGCHSGSSPTGNLNLESSMAYSQLMKHSSGYIDTMHPDYSLLYAQINSTSQPMPPTGNLDKCDLNLIYKWIQQKAKNN